MSTSAAAKALEPTLTPAASERPNLDECIERACKGRDEEGLMEAARLYGDDLRAELAAIEAGTHPLQRRRAAAR
jgi:hypothetical protein